MTLVHIKMRDGRTLCGPMCVWRPLEGWFELCNVEETIFLSNVVSARSVDPERTHAVRDNCPRCGENCTGLEFIDYLKKARIAKFREIEAQGNAVLFQLILVCAAHRGVRYGSITGMAFALRNPGIAREFVAKGAAAYEKVTP